MASKRFYETIAPFAGFRLKHDTPQRADGAPGERPVYHAGYYSAFVLDPDGNNIEVVSHNRRSLIPPSRRGSSGRPASPSRSAR